MTENNRCLFFRILKKKLASFLLCFLLFILTSPVSAQTEIQEGFVSEQETLEARIVRIVEEKQIRPVGSDTFQLYQKLELAVTKGSRKGETILVENGVLPLANPIQYKTNDHVIVNFSKDPEGNALFYITDYVRRGSLLWLFIIFLVATLGIAKWRGMLSLIGMGMSFLVIFLLVLPMINTGSDPVKVAILGSLLIIPVSFFLSHGFNTKTIVAIGGTLISLLITGFLADTFVNAAHLTGFSSEEAAFLEIAKQGAVNIRGLLLAGIIIGALGVLDDITVSQSAIVFQLKDANSKLSFRELYKRAMNVGQDHISSMVNTLILVYTGAALPLLLLFIDTPHPFSEVINYEIVADEVIRTLVGSIGLIVAVPITTLIASFVAERKK